MSTKHVHECIPTYNAAMMLAFCNKQSEPGNTKMQAGRHMMVEPAIWKKVSGCLQANPTCSLLTDSSYSVERLSISFVADAFCPLWSVKLLQYTPLAAWHVCRASSDTAITLQACLPTYESHLPSTIC